MATPKSCAASTLDMLKHVVLQLIKLNPAMFNEKACALICAKLRRTQTGDEWIDVLTSVLAGFERVFIVIDTGVESQRHASLTPDFSWPAALSGVFQQLRDKGMRT